MLLTSVERNNEIVCSESVDIALASETAIVL